MGVLSDRIGAAVEAWSERWKDRLRGWALRTLGEGMRQFLASVSPETLDSALESLKLISDDPNTPPEIRKLIGEATAGKSPIPMLLAIPIAVLLLVPTITSISQPLGRLLEYVQDRKLKSFRLDIETVINAWRRDKSRFEKFFDDLKDQGWNEERLGVAQELSKILAGVQDLIRFAVREVYTPEIAEKFGQFQDFPEKALPDAEKLGITPELLRNYWAAHWDLPSPRDGFEMLRRGVIDLDTLKLLLRALDVMPFWRDKLVAISWAVPTRVDVRRWWDMRTIDEARLRQIYAAQGYHDKDLEDYVLWTKVYTAFPDLLARYKNGWITLEQVKAQLVGMGMAPDRAEEMIEEKIKAEEPVRVLKERDLTKAEIVKGVKKGVISESEGVELLVDLGYDEDEAEFILAIEKQAAKGSPETLPDFKELTQKYRLAAGQEARPVPEGLKRAAAEVVRLTKEVEDLRAAEKEERGKLFDEENLPETATLELKKVQVALHRGEAALQLARQEYDKQLALYRHGGKPGG